MHYSSELETSRTPDLQTFLPYQPFLPPPLSLLTIPSGRVPTTARIGRSVYHLDETQRTLADHPRHADRSEISSGEEAAEEYVRCRHSLRARDQLSAESPKSAPKRERTRDESGTFALARLARLEPPLYSASPMRNVRFSAAVILWRFPEGKQRVNTRARER